MMNPGEKLFILWKKCLFLTHRAENIKILLNWSSNNLITKKLNERKGCSQDSSLKENSTKRNRDREIILNENEISIKIMIIFHFIFSFIILFRKGHFCIVRSFRILLNICLFFLIYACQWNCNYKKVFSFA